MFLIVVCFCLEHSLFKFVYESIFLSFSLSLSSDLMGYKHFVRIRHIAAFGISIPKIGSDSVVLILSYFTDVEGFCFEKLFGWVGHEGSGSLMMYFDSGESGCVKGQTRGWGFVGRAEIEFGHAEGEAGTSNLARSGEHGKTVDLLLL
jgi:hypothetical protein